MCQAVNADYQNDPRDPLQMVFARVKADAYAAGLASRGVSSVQADDEACAFTSWGECADHQGGDPLFCDKSPALAASPAPTERQWCADCGPVAPEHAAAHDEHHASPAPTENRGVGSDVIERVRALADEWEAVADRLSPGSLTAAVRRNCAAYLRAALASSTSEDQS